MKTTSFMLRFIIICVCLTVPVSIYAQDFETQPDRNVPYMRFSENVYACQRTVRANIPLITNMVAAVNVDTLHKTLQQLQNWGSRFMLNENRKEIATWLMNKFLSYGYTDVKLDSFYNIVNWNNIYIDSTWQYNVVCTLHGSSASDEIYVIGGHYDSYSDPDPYIDAPGADNNGSGTAATLEIARVMANLNFHPEATIRFILFAAEELGMFGSQYDAQKARLEGNDIRLMFNMDMVANNPDDLNEVVGGKYQNFEWACSAAAEAIERYTGLSVAIFEANLEGGTDSYSYWKEGFPSFGCQEYALSPYCFTPADTLGNCNVPYLAKITGGALATLAEQQLFPTPQNVIAHCTKEEITLQWKPTNNALVSGVNVYRSDTTGGPYQKITASAVSDTMYHDLMIQPNKQYYYVLATLNDSLQESGFSQEVSGARFNFCDTLLVLANLKGTQITPDSVFAFYHAILDTIPYVWRDINAIQKVNIGLLSRYHSILWISNTGNFEIPDNDLYNCVSEFISSGGNLLFTGFNPMKFWTNGATYPVKISETSIFHQIFKVDSADRKVQCMMFRANAFMPDYDTLNVDSLKYMDKNYPGQIYDIEVFSPAPEANVIYRLDTRFDSTTSLGKMKHRPVGLEYMGTDFKSILLSFPLYYIDSNDARKFIHYVMTEKFIHSLGIAPVGYLDPYSLQIYPNPVSDHCNVTFNLVKPGRIKLSLMSAHGQVLRTWIDDKIEQGTHSLLFNINALSPGSYYVVLQGDSGRSVKMVVRIM